MKSVFEKIIDNEIPSFKVYEDDNFIAILDVQPKQLGHTLLIPKKKNENILEEDALIRANMAEISNKIAKQLMKNLNATGVKFVSNVGKSAGQEVFHTHLHIIPYYDSEIEPVANEEILKKIKGN